MLKYCVEHIGSGDSVNEDSCFVCGELGQVCCCDICPKVYHLDCLPGQPKAKDLPDLWRCPDCVENMGTDSENASANASAAEDADRNTVLNTKPQNVPEISKGAKRATQPYASPRSVGLNPLRGAASGRSRCRKTQGSRSVSRRGALRSSSNHPRGFTVDAVSGKSPETWQ